MVKSSNEVTYYIQKVRLWVVFLCVGELAALFI
uniref:Uncharacterized protein n=1 Tax=Anguilla anguilla TaxID=7936 RepID=A0A0E9TCS1_ANGAN